MIKYWENWNQTHCLNTEENSINEALLKASHVVPCTNHLSLFPGNKYCSTLCMNILPRRKIQRQSWNPSYLRKRNNRFLKDHISDDTKIRVTVKGLTSQAELWQRIDLSPSNGWFISPPPNPQEEKRYHTPKTSRWKYLLLLFPHPHPVGHKTYTGRVITHDEKIFPSLNIYELPGIFSHYRAIQCLSNSLWIIFSL